MPFQVGIDSYLPAAFGKNPSPLEDALRLRFLVQAVSLQWSFCFLSQIKNSGVLAALPGTG